MLTVIKKDGTKEPFNSDKIIEAVNKAADRASTVIPFESEDTKSHRDILEWLYDYFSDTSKYYYKDGIPTSDIHSAVIRAVEAVGYPEVSKAYQEFRDYKNTYAKSFEAIKKQADDVLLLGDRENANFDSSLVSTKGSLIKGYLTKELYKQFYLSKEEKELTKRGDIYIHDLRDMILGCVNCCLFDVGTVLEDGFEMSNIRYTEPTSVLSALQVIGDITLVATAQQFGGFTIAEIDKVLLPYCVKSLWNAAYEYNDVDDTYPPYTYDNKWAWRMLERELEQGFQSLELKLNTVPCSRGDFAFTTITFGQWNPEDYSEQELKILALINKTILKVRRKGHGGKPVVFPKLTYLYDENQIKKDKYSQEVFEECVKCSCECMYPDYLSLSGNTEHNKVAETFLNHGAITSGMGCRAYLTPWADPETGKYVTIGRCNIGAVSLNLPIIMAYCKKTYGDKWKDEFYHVLENRLNVIRGFLKKRYDIIRHTKACTNPMAFTQGGFYKGFRKPDEEIGDLVDYMTASFGITALNEASILWTGKTLKEDATFANEVLDFINNKIEDYKKADGYLYALYGTPAESLCATQAKQYKDYTGSDEFGEYFTNSFHLHVSEKVTPFEKQDHEEELFHKVNGGHICYVRIDNPENFQAVKAVIQRGMAKGFYQGVNFDSVYCNECGAHGYNSFYKCPHCGSTNILVISRVCGYLGYSNVNGDTRMNAGKMAEIRDRRSM